LKDFLSKDKKDEKTSPMRSYIILIGLVGLLLLIINQFFTPTKQDDTLITLNDENQTASQSTGEYSDAKSNIDYSDLEKSYEKQLQTILQNIKGVSEVDVMVNLDSTNIKIYEKNLISGNQVTDEEDRNGGSRQIEETTEETQVVVIRQGDKETPLQVQTKKPHVRGVIIIAKGVENATVKKGVLDAVSKVLDVPTHRVSVMPKN